MALHYRGVDWLPKQQKWQAKIVVDGHVKYLGQYSTELQAAIAYNKASIHYRGRFALLNNVWGETDETLNEFKVVRKLTNTV